MDIMSIGPNIHVVNYTLNGLRNIFKNSIFGVEKEEWWLNQLCAACPKIYYEEL
jgi:hypothetical protein